MTTTETRLPWESRRTEESRRVEDLLLRLGGFQRAEAYRYNVASIRVRVIDPRFEGMSLDARDALVEPILAELPEEIQADIMSLLTFAPSEMVQSRKTAREFALNVEFEEPSPSML